MFNRARIRQDFNDAATRYDAHAALQRRVMTQLIEHSTINRSSLILDAGCGTGMLARLVKNTTIIALDNAKAMCDLATHSGNLPVNSDMALLPFADASIDCVFSSLALQWSLNWQATLQEWLRVLKPGGSMAFSTFGAGTLHELAASFRAVDGYPHVSDFIASADIKSRFPAHIHEETITEYYPDVINLARHLKALGARNKESNQRSGLTTPRQLRTVEQYYVKNYGTKEGLPVSWNIVYASLTKP